MKRCVAHKIRFLRQRSKSQSGQRSDLCLSRNSETTEANLMKLHRKIKHNENVCPTQDLGSYAHDQGHNQVRGHLSHNSETTEAKLMKLHRKIKHNEKICHTQDFGLYALGQGHSQVRGQVLLKMVSQQ